MPGEHYRHIFLPGPTRTQEFTNPRHGGSAPRIPARDRVQHSDYLRQQIESVWRDFEQRRAVVHVERHGAYIDFVSEPGFELAIQGLVSLRSGIRLGPLFQQFPLKGIVSGAHFRPLSVFCFLLSFPKFCIFNSFPIRRLF